MWKNRIAWLVMTLAGLGFYLFENNGGTRSLLLVLLLLPLFSALLLYLSPLRLTGEVELPEKAERETDAVGLLRLKNPGAFPVLRFRGQLLARNLLNGEVAETSILLSIPAEGVAEAEFSLCTAHSGKVFVSMRQAQALDLLGLFVRPLSLDAGQATPVPPMTSPVRVSFDLAGNSLNDSPRYSARNPGYDPGETFRIREYVPGDPVRQIHWKLSHKTGKVLLREFALPLVYRMLLLWESTIPNSLRVNPDAVDTQLDCLFSVSQTLCVLEIPHTVGWYDQLQECYVSREILTEEDLRVLQDALLENPFVPGDTSIAGVFGELFPEHSYAHIALFSLFLPPELPRLAQGNRITVLLPEPENSAGDSKATAWKNSADGAEVIPFGAMDLRNGNLVVEL